MPDLLDPSVTEALRSWRVQHGAGVAIPDALATSAPVCRTALAQACFNEASVRATNGEGIERVLLALSPVLTEAERASVAAGWNSGRGEEVMDRVVAQRELWFATRKRIRSKMILPALVLIMASFIAPLPVFIAGGTSALGYLVSAAIPLGVAFFLWTVGSRMFAARAAAATSTGPKGMPAPANGLDRVLLSFPLIRDIERNRNLGEFSSLMSNLVGAGLTMPASLDICARAVPNGIYRGDILRCADITRKGNPLTSALTAGALWPPEYVSSVRTGEKAGALEDVFLRMSDYARQKYIAAVEAIGEWTPRILYGFIAIFIIINIFRMVGAIGNMYDSVLK